MLQQAGSNASIMHAAMRQLARSSVVLSVPTTAHIGATLNGQRASVFSSVLEGIHAATNCV